MTEDTEKKQSVETPPVNTKFTYYVNAFFGKYYYAALMQAENPPMTRNGEISRFINHQLDTAFAFESLQMKNALSDLTISFMEQRETKSAAYSKLASEDCFSNSLHLTGLLISEPYAGNQFGVGISRMTRRNDCFNIHFNLEYLNEVTSSISDVLGKFKNSLQWPGTGYPASDKFCNPAGISKKDRDLRKKELDCPQLVLGCYTPSSDYCITVDSLFPTNPAVYLHNNPYLDARFLIETLEYASCYSLGWIHHLYRSNDFRTKNKYL